MKERRQYKRLSDELPVRLEAITSSKIRALYVKTKNISAGGIFAYTKEASYIPEDTRFIIDLTIPRKNKKLKNFEKCTGTWVRSTSEGIAIRFNRPAKLLI
jgi:c-di-GMP-binding flagellar brake protein YcgR